MVGAHSAGLIMCSVDQQLLYRHFSQPFRLVQLLVEEKWLPKTAGNIYTGPRNADTTHSYFSVNRTNRKISSRLLQWCAELNFHSETLTLNSTNPRHIYSKNKIFAVIEMSLLAFRIIYIYIYASQSFSTCKIGKMPTKLRQGFLKCSIFSSN